MSTEAEARQQGLIGPNAIVRLGEAVRNIKGPVAERDIFVAAGLDHFLGAPPRDMVKEADVRALHRALYRAFPKEDAEDLLRIAGVLTGRYLLANRIPPFAQTVIRSLPKPIGGRCLLSAIQKNSWTFAGTAEVTTDRGTHPALLMQKCQLCAGLVADARPCRYHEATIETLFRALVSPRTAATMTAFSARRGNACAVEIVW